MAFNAVTFGAVFAFDLIVAPIFMKSTELEYVTKKDMMWENDTSHLIESPFSGKEIKVYVNRIENIFSLKTDEKGQASVDVTEYLSENNQPTTIGVIYGSAVEQKFVKSINREEVLSYLAERKRKASLIPPQLAIATKEIKFNGNLKSGILWAEETGFIAVSVDNTDSKGTAWDVTLTVTGSRCSEVAYDSSFPVGDLLPGERKVVTIPVSAGLEVSDCQIDLTVQAKEKYGQDSKKVKLPSIAIKALNRPELTIASVKHTGIPQNDSSIEVVATVTNKGGGEAKGVVVSLPTLPLGITTTRQRIEIGDLPSGSTQDVPFTLQFDKLYGKEISIVNLTMMVADRRPIIKTAAKGYSVDYRFNSPQLRVVDLQFFDGNDLNGLSTGNSNGQIEQDERILVQVKISNTGSVAAKNLSVAFVSDKPNTKLQIQPTEPQVIAVLLSGEEKVLDFKFKVPVSLDPGTINFTVKAAEPAFELQLAEKSQRQIFEAGAEVGIVTLAAGSNSQIKTRVVPGTSENINEVPATNFSRDAFALIIGVGKYKEVDVEQVRFAREDALAMREYLSKIGGVPRDNIRLLTDDEATTTNIKKALANIQKRAGEDSQVVIYFAGHGVTDGSHTPYLLPYDGDLNDVEVTAFPITDLKQWVNKFQTKRVLVALDACYTGQGRSVAVVGARGIQLVAKDTTATGAVVINSSENNEASWDYDDKRHGIFTYYFLKGMRGAAPDKNRDGFVDADELFSYLQREVGLTAMKEKGARQTPVMQGNGNGMVISKRAE